jgi:cyclopropane fatty-acyl-phospholipid synthase-like methyltransferase
VASSTSQEFFTKLFRGAERRAPGGEALARRIASLLGVERGDKVLDVGCGAGLTARMIARECSCFVTCVDRDETSLTALKAAAQLDGVEGLMTPIVGDFKSLTPPPVGYQAVVIEGSLRYLGQGFDEVVGKARDFLALNGLLTVSATARVGRVLPAAVESFYKERGDALRQPWELTQVLEKCGFEPLSAEAYADAVMDEWYKYVEQALTGMNGAETTGAGLDGAETVVALRREIEVFRREGGRSCVNEVLFIARRKESGEKPPPSRGGE